MYKSRRIVGYVRRRLRERRLRQARSVCSVLISLLVSLLLSLPFFREITACNNGIKPIFVSRVSCIRLYPTSRGYCAAINHSCAHKRIHHPPQSHSRYLFSTEGDARGRTKASGLFRAFLHALAYEISFSTGLPSFDRLRLKIFSPSPFFSFYFLLDVRWSIKIFSSPLNILKKKKKCVCLLILNVERVVTVVQ